MMPTEEKIDVSKWPDSQDKKRMQDYDKFSLPWF